MKKFQKLYQLKQLVKANAEFSKYCRLTAKAEHNPEYDVKLREAQANITLLNEHKVFMDNRLLHIAYSLLKGKQYPQVENSVREQNELEEYEWKKIVSIMEKYKDEENTCIIPTSPFPTTKVNLPKVNKVEAPNE